MSPTLLETMSLINRMGEIDARTRDEVRRYMKKRFPEHLDNLNKCFKRGYIEKGLFYGIFLSDKGILKLKELTRQPTLVRLGNNRYGTAIVDENGKVLEWVHHPDDPEEEKK